MAVQVNDVEKGSLCDKKGIVAGFSLISVNGHDINDVLDYRFYASSKRINIVFQDTDNNEILLHLKTSGNVDDLGLKFETYLMDKQHSCKNKCIFCFVDQMPHGMRNSLYFKDDDSRLSFLFGNYVTLTNMTENDINRLVEMHISPVNISVHTMNPKLRVEMMKNPHAGEVLKYLKMLADGGIEINAQLVLCPDYNDGDELDYSLNELKKLGKSVISVAAVPVGLTKHREGLCKLTCFNEKTAGDVIDRIDAFNRANYNEFSRNFAYASDEFYILANRKMPDCEYYDEFRQLDNGVGLCSLTKSEFIEALDEIDSCRKRKVALITGVAASPLMTELSDMFCKKFTDSVVDVKTIVNDFFGHSVTVAGLVTAGDIINQLKDLSDYDYALVPSVMLKEDGSQVFLDDISLEQLSKELNVKIIVTAKGGRELLYSMLGRSE